MRSSIIFSSIASLISLFGGVKKSGSLHTTQLITELGLSSSKISS
ncbi:MAG: hypothetical protein QXT34_00390 [Candidatus Aenigmatarchaeota archaeon]